MRHTPKKISGLGIPEQKMDQKLSKINDLMAHGAAVTLIGNKSQFNIEQ